MKKTMRDIVITIVMMGIICFAFRQIGWITSAKEIYVMFVITGVVIMIDLFARWLGKKLLKRE